MPRGHGGFTLIELMIVVAIIGVLAAIAVPNFVRYQGKARQAEAAYVLGNIFTGEVSYYAGEGRYGSFGEIGFQLAGSTNRYTYRSPASGGTAGSTGTPNGDLINSAVGSPTPENSVVASAASFSVSGVGAKFTATATGNLDSDGTVDQWHVNDMKLDLSFPDVSDL